MSFSWLSKMKLPICNLPVVNLMVFKVHHGISHPAQVLPCLYDCGRTFRHFSGLNSHLKKCSKDPISDLAQSSGGVSPDVPCVSNNVSELSQSNQESLSSA